MGHVVQFSPGLGLDPYDMGRRVVVPAWKALEFLEHPRIQDTDWDADFRRSQFKKVLQDLESWGGAMVSIRPWGIVVGDYWLKPYLIGPKQYEILRIHGLA